MAGGWKMRSPGERMPALSTSTITNPSFTFAKYADGTEARTLHLKDEDDFISAAKEGTLPAVSFVKPVGIDNEHPITPTS